MGYDLRARNKNVEVFSIGAFSWPWMLESGLGLVIGYGKGIKPGSFMYTKRPDSLCVAYNDGAKVTAKEAKLMSVLALSIADYQDSLREQYELLSDEDKDVINKGYRGLSLEHLYNIPVRRDFVERLRAFAEFAKSSGGFRIY